MTQPGAWIGGGSAAGRRLHDVVSSGFHDLAQQAAKAPSR